MAKPTNRPAECHPEKPTHGHGLCQKCYDRKRKVEKHEQLRVYAREYYARNRVQMRAKENLRRQINQEERRQYGKEYYAKNKERIGEQTKAYRQRKIALIRDSRFKKLYGISLEDYEIMLSKQGGVCAVCQRNNHQKRRLAVDHDHKTDKVRGLLCGGCNAALGHFQDNPLTIDQLAEYIRRFQ